MYAKKRGGKRSGGRDNRLGAAIGCALVMYNRKKKLPWGVFLHGLVGGEVDGGRLCREKWVPPPGHLAVSGSHVEGGLVCRGLWLGP